MTIPIDDPRLIRLDLAGGQTPKEGFRTIDKFHGAPEDRWDLLKPWPLADNSVDELHCSHFIEHIPMVELGDDATDALIWFFNEAYRVAKPGTSFSLVWPALQSVRAFQDPTHRRFIPLQTMLYFSKEWRDLNKLDHYLGATCNWTMVSGCPTIMQDDALKSDLVQANNFKDHWNWAQDLTCVLKCNKV